LPQSLVRRAALPLAALVVASLGVNPAAAAPPHVHVQPIVNFALPPASAGCGGASTLLNGSRRLPITVSTVAGQVSELINVCIEGHGPYPFVVDTGAGESIIDAHLAARLHLKVDGSGTGIEGVGCTAKAHPVRLASWKAAGLALAPQTLTAATLPDFGAKGLPVGLLGSDVLSRFGAVRVDFAAQTLTLPGQEGPAAAAPTTVSGPTGPPPTALLTEPTPGTTVPATVTLTPGIVGLSVRVRLARGASHEFVVDTGSSQSVMASSIVAQDHLAHTDQAQRQSTVCSTITVPLVRTGAWSIPGVMLHPQLIGSVNFGPIGADGTGGLLGSDQLKRFGWVIFDYTGGRLVLG
jgi:aspartyl protease